MGQKIEIYLYYLLMHATHKHIKSKHYAFNKILQLHVIFLIYMDDMYRIGGEFCV